MRAGPRNAAILGHFWALAIIELRLPLVRLFIYDFLLSNVFDNMLAMLIIYKECTDYD